MKLVPEKGKEIVEKFLLKMHLNNMSYKHSSKFKFGIKAIYQNLKWQVLWSMANGWRISESRELHPVYYTESGPAEVRNIMHLYYSDKTYTGQKCPCVVAGLSCIDICSCADECQNPNKPAESEGEVTTDV